MEQFVKLGSDMASLWSKYGGTYMGGIWRTLILASVGTAIGCLIGFLCGIVQTIPVSRNDSVVKKVILKIVQVILRIYVEVFRGTPMILQAVFIFYGLPYFTNNPTLPTTRSSSRESGWSPSWSYQSIRALT